MISLNPKILEKDASTFSLEEVKKEIGID